MSEPDQLLDVLQADIVAVLKNTPALANAFIFTGSEKDLATRLNKTFGTRTNSTGGKRGLAIQVLPIFTDEAEANLPGPPLMLQCRILTIESVTLNRAAATGTLKTSSQTALNILTALHHHTIGGHALYADKKPIIPEKMEDGFEGHLVTVNVRANGLTGPGKVQQVEAATGDTADSMVITGSLSYPGGALSFPPLLYAGEVNGRPSYTPSGEPDAATQLFWDTTHWLLYWDWNNISWSSDDDVPTPDLVTTWIALNDADGIPTATANSGTSAITLTCATAGAAIYYTTDGSYPTPANGTLYTAPITEADVGDTWRVAAYKTGLNPSDCLEFTIAAPVVPDGALADGDFILTDANGSVLTDP